MEYKAQYPIPNEIPEDVVFRDIAKEIIDKMRIEDLKKIFSPRRLDPKKKEDLLSLRKIVVCQYEIEQLEAEKMVMYIANLKVR